MEVQFICEACEVTGKPAKLISVRHLQAFPRVGDTIVLHDDWHDGEIVKKVVFNLLRYRVEIYLPADAGKYAPWLDEEADEVALPDPAYPVPVVRQNFA